MVESSAERRTRSSNGACFGEDVVLELPFIETRAEVRWTSVGYGLDGWQEVDSICVHLINQWIHRDRETVT
jgi:hypothetical protein